MIALVLGNINSHRGNVQKGSFDDLSQTAEQVQTTATTSCSSS